METAQQKARSKLNATTVVVDEHEVLVVKQKNKTVDWIKQANASRSGLTHSTNTESDRN